MKAIAYMIILGGMLLMVSPLVSATCVQGDAAGTWHSYSNSVDFSDGYYWLRCKFVVNSTGVMNTTSSWCKDPYGNTYYAQGGSSFLVSSACKVSGNINAYGVNNKIVEAWLNRSKNVISGVGTWNNGWFTFTAIKQ